MTLIPGDGVGPELAACVKEVFRYTECYTLKLTSIICLLSMFLVDLVTDRHVKLTQTKSKRKNEKELTYVRD